jgi:hypothetical protein
MPGQPEPAERSALAVRMQPERLVLAVPEQQLLPAVPMAGCMHHFR